jgi:hypothetical protein
MWLRAQKGTKLALDGNVDQKSCCQNIFRRKREGKGKGIILPGDYARRGKIGFLGARQVASNEDTFRASSVIEESRQAYSSKLEWPK